MYTYNVMKDGKILDVVDLPEKAKESQLRKGFKNIHNRLIGRFQGRIYFEKMQSKDIYLVKDKYGKLLYELRKKAPWWKRMFGKDV